MAFTNFNEFLEKKAKEVPIADYPDKSPEKPAKNGKYPDAPKESGEVLPYSNKSKDTGLEMADEDGSPALAQISGMQKGKEKPLPRPKVHKSSSKQLKEFYGETKDLSDAEFLRYLAERKDERLPVAMVHDLHGEPFTPDPHQTIKYICSLMHNPRMISRLVQEAKRHGHLESLVAELLDHPEFYDEVVKSMGDDHGKQITDKLARSMADHHNDFKKSAGFMETYKNKNKQLLNEKVSPSVINHDFEDMDDLNNDDMPSDAPESDSTHPDDETTQTAFEPSEDDTEHSGASEGMPEPDRVKSPGKKAAHRMIQSVKSSHPEHFDNFCADGNC